MKNSDVLVLFAAGFCLGMFVTNIYADWSWNLAINSITAVYDKGVKIVGARYRWELDQLRAELAKMSDKNSHPSSNGANG